MERHADAAEKLRSVGRRKRAQHAPDDGAPPAPEIAFARNEVRDVAAATAAHENLRARPLRSVKDDEMRAGRATAREDRGRQTRGAGTDDRDVELIARRRGILQADKLTVLAPVASAPSDGRERWSCVRTRRSGRTRSADRR